MAQERLDLGKHFGLRILRDGMEGPRVLNTPYEIAPDDMVTMEHLNGDPKIVLIRLVDTPTPPGYLPFERYMLISSWNDQQNARKFLVTLSGYEFDDEVRVAAWKDSPKYKDRIEPAERRRLDLVRSLNTTKVLHVQDLEKAAALHRYAGNLLRATDIALNDAVNIYEAILYTVPR